ncbi:MAG: aminotransferase class I/II-fold pyridoxal phosphate-dependent enzyme [Microthrixaceae bacterium]
MSSSHPGPSRSPASSHRPRLSPAHPLADVGTTIFAEMGALAAAHDAINLGQGAPDVDGPAEMIEAAAVALRKGPNQYAPGTGIPQLRQAIADHQARYYDLTVDADEGVLVTVGCTEGIAASLLGVCVPGDEVVVLEPSYDSYGAVASLAGATLVPVTLQSPEWRLDGDALAAAVTDRTRAMLINSPHNPTGRVLDADERDAVARVAIEHDLIVITDEVYEHLTFDGHRHVPLATMPGMFERTITLSSAAKTFAMTGWKVGWASGPPDLVAAAKRAKQFLTYTSSGALQHGVVAGLALGDEPIDAIRNDLDHQRQLLVEVLTEAGFSVRPPEAGYFITADAAWTGVTTGREFCELLPAAIGVAAIPLSSFYLDPQRGGTLVRFAFCKQPDLITEAGKRLSNLTPGSL